VGEAAQAAATMLARQPLAAADVLALQRTIGNAAVGRLLQQQSDSSAALALQARRTLGLAPDSQPAGQVGAAVQRQTTSAEQAESGDLAQRLQAASRGGRALASGVQRRLEAGLGASLAGVRVHTGGEADSLSRAVQAVAFTTGSNIFFRTGTYNPSTPQGMHLLAHEAAHTVQQARGPVSGAPHPGGVSISDPTDRFERAAETAAHEVTAAAQQPVQRAATTAVQRTTGPEAAGQLLRQNGLVNGPGQPRSIAAAQDGAAGQGAEHVRVQTARRRHGPRDARPKSALPLVGAGQTGQSGGPQVPIQREGGGGMFGTDESIAASVAKKHGLTRGGELDPEESKKTQAEMVAKVQQALDAEAKARAAGKSEAETQGHSIVQRKKEEWMR
jgi:hypothetical protein